MAFPASTKTLESWAQATDSQLVTLKFAAQQQHALSLANNLDMDFIRRFFDLLVQTNVFCSTVSAVPGIAAYMVAQKQNQVADPVAEFVAMRSAVVNTLNWLRANLPSGAFGGQNYAMAFFLPTDNTTQISALKFTAAQTAGYRTVLTSLIGTIS